MEICFNSQRAIKLPRRNCQATRRPSFTVPRLRWRVRSGTMARARAAPGGRAAMELPMDDTARLRVEIALLRARVDSLQNDLLDLVALHSHTLSAVAHLAGVAP